MAFVAPDERVRRQSARQLGLRDVRLSPEGGLRNVLYHVAIYLGRTDVPRDGFRPQRSEIADLADEEKEVFLADMGLHEPGLNRLIRAAFMRARCSGTCS